MKQTIGLIATIFTVVGIHIDIDNPIHMLLSSGIFFVLCLYFLIAVYVYIADSEYK